MDGDRNVAWHRGSFQQLPARCRVINGIEDLDVVGCRRELAIEFSGPMTGVWANTMRAAEV